MDEIEGTPPADVISTPLLPVVTFPSVPPLLKSSAVALPLATVVTPTVMVPADAVMVQVEPNVQV